jgi:hypothetical protein
VNWGGEQAEAAELPPWKPPADGFERQLRPGWTERRQRPLTRGRVRAIRVACALTATFSIAVFSLGLPPASLCGRAAMILPVALAFNLVWFSPYQLGQVLGLRPPDRKA